MLARRLLFGNSAAATVAVAASFRRSLSSGRGSFGRARVPIPKNEPFLHYAPGSAERAALDVELLKMKRECPEIPLIIGGQRVKTGKLATQVMPTKHAHALCTYHEVTEAASRQAIEAALAAKAQWEHMPFEDRAAIFLKCGCRCLQRNVVQSKYQNNSQIIVAVCSFPSKPNSKIRFEYQRY